MSVATAEVNGREHHQEAKPDVRADAAVDGEVGLACLLALQLRCERGQQRDDRVSLSHALPGGGDREEDRDDRLARPVPVGGDRVDELPPRGQLVEVLLEPCQHAVADSWMNLRRAGDTVLVERMPDLMERRWHSQPHEQRDCSADDEEVKEDREGLGDAVSAESLDAGSDRGREGEGEEQEDDDGSHLPQAKGEGGDGKRGGGGLRDPGGEVAVGVRVGSFRRLRLSGLHRPLPRIRRSRARTRLREARGRSVASCFAGRLARG
jgi:hypothetical protein